MNKKKNNRFAKGSAVYTCQSCGKKTRETGAGESFVRVCRYCWEEGGQMNLHDDEGHAGSFETCAICKEALSNI